MFYRKTVQLDLTNQIGIAPAYLTRERDNVFIPDMATFTQGYRVLNLTALPSKTKEVAFQVLNRTLWTNNKAFRSGLSDDPSCGYCDEVETMEHLLHDCPHYSSLMWDKVSSLLTDTCSSIKGEPVARMTLTPKEIIFNKPHLSLHLHIKDKEICQALIIFVQELKRNLVFRRMNIGTHHQNRPVSLVCICAHLLSVLRKVRAMFEYKGLLQYRPAIQTFHLMAQLVQNYV